MFGVDDPERDQIVVAVVVAPTGRPLDVERLRGDIKSKVSAYKVPRTIVRLAPEDSRCCRAGSPTWRGWRRSSVAS